MYYSTKEKKHLVNYARNRHFIGLMRYFFQECLRTVLSSCIGYTLVISVVVFFGTEKSFDTWLINRTKQLQPQTISFHHQPVLLQHYSTKKLFFCVNCTYFEIVGKDLNQIIFVETKWNSDHRMCIRTFWWIL